ncbi:MAG: InlB B-repeat-containing protein, partial [Oscillospiraceae bacterium]|nr:InlB B-repeat-containing protein [Oscillospiraceae bacterium]
VNATGGNGAAGIGGTDGAGGTLRVTGGSVTATGGGSANALKLSAAPTIDGMQVKAGAVATEEIIENATFAENYATYKWVCIGIFHEHKLSGYELATVNAENDSIKAVCNADLEHCTLGADHIATLTIASKDDGTATLTGGADFGVSDANIVYTKNGEPTNAQAIKESTEAAFYQASITVGGQTASVEYGVRQITLNKAYTNESDHGTIPDDNVPSVATIGATVRIPTIPAAGYQLKGITASGASDVSKDGNTGTFTMPNSAVTVSAEFEKRNVGVTLAVNKDSVAAAKKASCTAALLTYDAESQTYTPAPENFTSQVGDTFILRVDSDEAYSFKITGSTDDFTFTALSSSDKKAYVSAHADADENTQLFEVTMPAVASGDLTVTVTFLEIKNYTVLYQPVETTNTVWCKIGSGDKSFQLKMNPDAQMGNVKTFALNVSMTSAPQKIAFGTADLVADATLTDVSVKENANDAKTWQTVTGSSDKFLVISGSARTLIAAFTPNNTPYTVNAADVNGLPEGTQYQIAVCGTDENGAVTTPGKVNAPATPERTGYVFDGWSGFEGAAPNVIEKLYSAAAEISLYDDAIFSAAWHPQTFQVNLNLNGGEGQSVIDNVDYRGILSTLTDPTKANFVFDGWKVGKNVTESGTFYAKGSRFDTKTPITSNLELEAQWKHVHSYTCVPLDYEGFNGALNQYSKYFPYLHVNFCACGDVNLEAHTFRNGSCVDCGYTDPRSTTATLNISYWKDDKQWMEEDARTETIGGEVTVNAFWQIGQYRFSKWQYRTPSETTWHDLSADTMVGFIFPCALYVRALYVDTVTQPQVSLSARRYVTQAEGYDWDSVLFQMEYKLPSNCTYVDSGIRMGDNQGISFYSLKKRKVSAFETAFNFITSDPISFAVDSLTSDPDYIIEKREDNVLNTMSAETLAKYMMENKPINIPEYEPIYWQASPTTKGRTGSVNTLTPLRFIQKNNGNHFIYGVGWLRYKDKDGIIRTINTPALATTRDSVPDNTVTKTGQNGQK